MKKIALLFTTCILSFCLQAQTTFDIDWFFSVGSSANLTIEVDDTVRWTWADTSPHSVTSIDGQSQETFDSGILTGVGQQFSYTFTQEGTNDYQCEVHPGAMFGTITVEENLSIEEKFFSNLNYFPNPVNDKLTVTSLFMLDSSKMYNVLGEEIFQQNEKANVLEINMSNLNNGIYFVTVSSGDLIKTFKIVKR